MSRDDIPLIGPRPGTTAPVAGHRHGMMGVGMSAGTGSCSPTWSPAARPRWIQGIRSRAFRMNDASPGEVA